jgi:hypothetical protein
MARRTTILLDDKLFSRLLQIQSKEILRANTTVSISSIINNLLAENLNAEIPRKITALAIENVLLEISKKTMQDIGKRLYEKHHMYFADYILNQEPLEDVLKEEFGPAHKSILEKIDAKLQDRDARRKS